MRDITAHRYQTMEDVYLTIHDEYPWLKNQLLAILEKEQNRE